MTTTTYPRLDPSQVVVYLSEADITGRYERVALIHAEGDATHTSEAHMLRAARKRAARLGANGIVLHEVNEPSTGWKVAAAVLGVETSRQGKLLAVYVFPEEPVDN